MKTQPCFDVVVVGSGACGALAARQLTARGLTVCVLEAGPAEPPPRNEDTNAQQVQSKSLAFRAGLSHFYIDDELNPYTTEADAPFLWIRGRQLGGRTRTWATHCPRLSQREVLTPPAPFDIGQRWPLGYEELTREYEEVEEIIHVIGAAEAANATPNSKRLAARQMNDVELGIKAAIEARWPDRVITLAPYASAVESPEADRGEAGDRFAGYMSGNAALGPLFACSTKSTLRDAIDTGRLTLRTDAVVRSVELSADGRRASGVVFVDRTSGQVESVNARYVMLCASTLESTRILLNSTSAQWPEGLANSSGTLGRYLSDHLWGVGAIASRPGHLPRPLVWPPLILSPYPLDGGGELGRFQFYFATGEEPGGRIALRVRASGEASSLASNRVTLDPHKVDAWNIPVLHIHCVRSAADLAMAATMSKHAVEMAEAAGFAVSATPQLEPPGISIHEVGTARMGADSKTSVVNSYCQSWDIPNLFIADGAVFPRATSRPPTLTMMALASRACRRLSEMAVP